MISKKFKNSNSPNLWNFPGGGLARGEKSYKAVLREIKEEVGLKPKDLNLVDHFKIRIEGKGSAPINLYIFLFISYHNKVRLNKKELRKHSWSRLYKIKMISNQKLHRPTYEILKSTKFKDKITTFLNFIFDDL